MKEYIIDKTNENQRLDKYLKRLMPSASNSFIYKMLRKKNIELNSKRANGDEILKASDSVKLFFSEETFLKMSSNAVSNATSQYSEAFGRLKGIEIVFEHSDFMVVNKPAGVLSQKSKESDLSLNEWAVGYLLKSGFITLDSLSFFKPSVLNRLDRNTRGLVLVSKTLTGSRRLSEMLSKRTLHKYYIAKTNKGCPLNGIYSAFLYKNEKINKVCIYDREEDIPSSVKFSPIKTGISKAFEDDKFTYLDIELITGKSHQIRAHLSHLGYPIVGDCKYNGDSASDNFQDLMAYKIIFPHIDDNDDWSDLSEKVISLR